MDMFSDDSEDSFTMSRMDESAFGLSAEELSEITSMDILNTKRRKPQKPRKSTTKLNVPFTMQLSKEAQIAMELAREDTKQMIAQEALIKDDFRGGRPNHNVLPTLQEVPNSNSEDFVTMVMARNRPETSVSSSESSSSSSFTEIYKRRQSARMHRDITDETFDETRQRKRALGGGKIESTMELIEVVRADDVAAVDDEARLIDELAMTNAVDKCMVWMEATGDMMVDE